MVIMQINKANNSQGPSSEINMTPLIDVLLVLLIIFMVITPLKPKGLPASAPQSFPTSAPAQDGTQTVLSIRRDASLQINQQDVAPENLASRLSEIFRNRAQPTCFLKAHPDLEYRFVAQAIDTIKGAGATQLGLLSNRN